MVPMNAVVPLAAARRPVRADRVAYGLARLRVADLHEPPPRLASLVRGHA